MSGKIRSYTIKEKSEKVNIQIPVQWIRDLKLRTGDSIDLLRDETDRLILVANKKEEQEKEKVEIK